MPDAEVLECVRGRVRDKKLTGADLAHLCHQAAACCVKDAISHDGADEAMAVRREHFKAALKSRTPGEQTSPFTPETMSRPVLQKRHTG